MKAELFAAVFSGSGHSASSAVLFSGPLQKLGAGWVIRKTVTANRDGILEGRIPGRRTTGFFRARVGTADVSLSFPLRPTPDLNVPVFGG